MLAKNPVKARSINQCYHYNRSKPLLTLKLHLYIFKAETLNAIWTRGKDEIATSNIEPLISLYI